MDQSGIPESTHEFEAAQQFLQDTIRKYNLETQVHIDDHDPHFRTSLFDFQREMKSVSRDITSDAVLALIHENFTLKRVNEQLKAIEKEFLRLQAQTRMRVGSRTPYYYSFIANFLHDYHKREQQIQPNLVPPEEIEAMMRANFHDTIFMQVRIKE